MSARSQRLRLAAPILAPALALILAWGPSAGPALAQEGTTEAAPDAPGRAPARAPLRAPGAWPAGLDAALACVVKVYGAGGFTGIPAYGSGVLVDERGFVLTAWSIALRTDDLKVVDAEGRRYRAQVWAADPGRGVALLRVDGLGRSFAALRPAEHVSLRPGDPVLAIGNPFGIVFGAELPAVAVGVVSARLVPGHGLEHVEGLPGELEDVLLTDVPNNPGTQGGPLLTPDGALVGILGRPIESRATNTIVNFAVPTSAVVEFVRAATAAPTQRPELLEVPPDTATSPVDVGVHLQRAHLVRSPLAYVERVVAGSPAAAAGLQPEDLIFRVSSPGRRTTIRSCRDWDEALSGVQPGATLTLVVKRGEAMHALTLLVPEGAR